MSNISEKIEYRCNFLISQCFAKTIRNIFIVVIITAACAYFPLANWNTQYRQVITNKRQKKNNNNWLCLSLILFLRF